MSHKSPTLSNATMAKWARVWGVCNTDNCTVAAIPYTRADIHYQMGNRKTGATGEGTSAMMTCVHTDKLPAGEMLDWRRMTPERVEQLIMWGVIPPCARSCYALRQMIQYPAYAAAMWRNTWARRKDPADYYRAMFEFAVRHDRRLRVNESGDFETRAQVRALYAVAREYPSVRVWGYTQRPPAWIAGAPENVIIRVSCWLDTGRAARLERAGYLTACVTTDNAVVNCPAQRLAPDSWHCADCAARGCGCCGGCKRVNFRMH